MRRWYAVGDPVEIRVDRRTQPGTVVELGRVMDAVKLDTGGDREWRHPFEIFAPEGAPTERDTP